MMEQWLAGISAGIRNVWFENGHGGRCWFFKVLRVDYSTRDT